MKLKRVLAAIAFAILVVPAWVGAAPAQSAKSGTPVPTDPWPRPVTLGKAHALVYQPQVNAWVGNVLDFRAAVAIVPAGSKEETFGMISGTARTQVEKVTRKVTLEDVTLTKVLFPTLPENGAAYTPALQKQLPAILQTIALDRLQASLEASGTVKPAGIPVNNTPPTILVSYTPALLIPIDGAPVLRPVPGTAFERVINTQALLLRPLASSTFYLHVYDGWLYAGTLQGPWYQPFILPANIDQVARNLAAAGVVDLIDGGKAKPKPSLANGVPTIYISYTPTELLVFNGQPALTPIPGTTLEHASNTANDVLFDTATREYFVLLSGRWFRSGALTGPWTFVASTSLPADFKRIPPDSSAGIVLASVAGTPQAQEAVIANSIPQTATIPRVHGPTFTPVIDGPPVLRPIAGTPLEYVFNTPTPIIQVDANLYYALQGGVWFSATAVTGPWYVAASVPAVIYTIPPTSPLHYVTYVYVYGSTAKVVYVGYTPGYLGTVVTPGGVVVYGTGYTYPTYVGTVWYPPPVTYGVMAQPVYNPAVGMTFGFAMGVATASATYAWHGGAYYHPAYYGYPCCGSASANVYGQYGNTAYSGTRSWYNTGSSYATNASGTFHNYATGGSGTYSGARSYNPSTGQTAASFGASGSGPRGAETVSGGYSYNPSTGQSAASYGRAYTTPSGQSGTMSRSYSYDAQTGTYARSGGAAETGPGGKSASVSGAYSSSPGQQSGYLSHTTSNANTGLSKTATTSGATGQGMSHSTTVSDSKTGQSYTHTAGQAYTDKQGNVYKNSDSGWQQHTSSGWQSASANSASEQEREQQARSEGEQKFNSFKQSGNGSGSSWASRDGGGGGWGSHSGSSGGWGSHSGGSDWASHFGGSSGGGWASRFGGGGGGWGHSGGGGGWGGHFGGFRR